MVRKLGAPRNRELAVGALAEDGTAIVDRALAAARPDAPGIEGAWSASSARCAGRCSRFRDDFGLAEVDGRTVIVVDDGLATGLSDLAAVRALRARGAAADRRSPPRRITRGRAHAALGGRPGPLPHRAREGCSGSGHWYEDFSPVSDEEVLAVLAGAGTRTPGRSRGAPELGDAARRRAGSTHGGDRETPCAWHLSWPP